MSSSAPGAGKSGKGLYGQRPSASADAARRAEFAETWAMTARERVLLALELADRSDALRRALAQPRPATPR